MSFDEQLRRAFDTLTDRLRDDIVRELRAVSDEVVAAARADTEQATSTARAEAAAAVQAGVDRTIDERVAAVVREAEARIADAETAALAKVQEAERTADARVANASAAADARTAAAVAAAEARVKDEADRQMRDAIDAAVAAALAEVETPAPAPVDPAAHDRQVAAFRDIDAAQTLTGILDAMLDAAGREARSVLLLVGGGQLRAWRFAGFSGELSTAHHVAVPFAEAAVITAAVRDRITTVGDPSSAPRFAALPQGRACVAIPILMAGQAVAVLYADEGDALSAPPASHWRDVVETIARYGARSLEALTAFKAAGLMAKQATGRAPLGRAPQPSGVGGGARDATTDEDESARRYARLLVSEIKLYHEADVAAGQRERNLAARLSAEIDRARVLYEQRVPAELRLRTDYFHAELVRTLANGDASLLSTL